MLPTERDLDRLTAAIRAAGRKRGFDPRLTRRYLEWIFLFVGWCLRAPPGRVHRSRIGDFWAALDEHPDTGKARICEAMDALGFFFGHLHREIRILFFPVCSKSTKRGADRWEEGRSESNCESTDFLDFDFSRPSPNLRVSEEAFPSTEVLSDRQMSRYLPSGTLPKEADVRAEIPTRNPAATGHLPSRERHPEKPSSPSKVQPRSEKPNDQSRQRDAPVTLFNPEGDAPSSSQPSHEDTSESPSRPGESNSSERETDGPPAGTEEDSDPENVESTHNPEDGRVPVHLPRDVAKQLRRASEQLGLPSWVVAARSIELVCDEAGIDQAETPSGETPVEHYQTLIDLIRLQREDAKEAPFDDGDRVDGRARRESTAEGDGCGSDEDVRPPRQRQKKPCKPQRRRGG